MISLAFFCKFFFFFFSKFKNHNKHIFIIEIINFQMYKLVINQYQLIDIINTNYYGDRNTKIRSKNINRDITIE